LSNFRFCRLICAHSLAALFVSWSVAAQTVRADRVTLNAGPCVITSGPTPPNGNRVGNPCDTFIVTPPNAGAGAIWTKTSGTGTSSGWIATLAGTGTPGTLAVWTSAGAIGDSIIAQAGGVATITGAEHVTGNSTIDAALAVGGSATITGAATLRSNLDVTGATTLRADTSISGNTVLGGWIGSVSYASQVSGWRITNTGALDARYIFTDEMRAKLFAADAESVLAGSMRVTTSYSTVAQPFTCPAAGATSPLWVYDASTYGDAPVFQANHFVVIHVMTRTTFGPFTITDCVGQVSAYVDGSGANAGQQQWTFTRSAGANGGAMTGGTVVPVNQLVQDMGVSGSGYVEISAIDGTNGANSPYIQTNTWITSPIAANTTTNCRLGNLNGLTALGDYGLVCGNFTATGQFFWFSTRGVEMRNMPLTMFDNGTQVFSVDYHGPSLALGNPLPTAYAGTGANTGLWAGKDTNGTYKLRIGNPTGNRLTWDGNTLSIAGEGSGITNINGGNIQAGTISAAQISVVGNPGGAAINPNPGVSDAAFWPAVPGYTAPLVVTITDGMVGMTALRSPPGRGDTVTAQAAYPIDPNKTYRLHFWTRGLAGASGNVSLHLVPRDGNGNALGNAGIDVLPGTMPTNTWTEFHLLYGPANFPGGTRTIQIYLYINWTGTTSATGYAEAQDVRLEEATPNTLITPGAITTDKIAAKTITAANVAANSLTVAEINATGLGDNLIGNSTFEGTMAGWSLDPVAPNGGSIYLDGLGPRGPGDLVLAPTGGGGMLAEYFAVPVYGGQPYRIAFQAAPYSQVGTGLFLRIYESKSTAQVRYVRAGGGAYQPGDIGADSSTDPASFPYYNLNGGWTQFEFTYTPPPGVFWVSLAFFNYTCVSGYGNGCQSLGLDGVEMQAQIGAGRIRANSITANNIAVGTITGDRIAARTIISGNIATGTISANEIGAGTITGDRIAGGTITGSNIAGRTITAGALVANTITSNEIGVRAIVAGNIATGTLTANEIAAGTITADRMNVSSLSAINANLGNITAGNISSVTISGSTVTAGCATMNSNGITLTAGGGACNWYKFSNGTIGLSSDGGAWMYLQAQNVQVQGTGSGGYLNFTSDTTLHGANQVLLDSNNNQIHLYNSGYIQLSVSSLSGTGAGAHLCLTTDNYLQRCQ
jgi:hypothetical protein